MKQRLTCLLMFCFIVIKSEAQETKTSQFSITVSTNEKNPLPGATVELHRSADSVLLKTAITDANGKATFDFQAGIPQYLLISAVGFMNQHIEVGDLPLNQQTEKLVTLQPAAGLLAQVTVTGKKPFIQLMPDKTIVNVDAGITNSGASVLEVLEKSPGVTVDKDGNISLKGKQNVLILIDGKPTYLPATEIAQMLGGMNASQIDQLEIMDNPPAKYDASGNAGVINLRTKKLKQRGFNGNISSSYGQGHYYKNNNSFSLNYRQDKFNIFFTYSSAFNKGFTDLYALRTYYEANSVKPVAVLNQDTWLTSRLKNHTIRMGADYYLGKSTTIGIAFTGIRMNRNGTGDAASSWLSPAGITDSLVTTNSSSLNTFKNAGGNLNFRREFGKGKELTADIDYLDYSIQGNQLFYNIVKTPTEYTESVKGNLPSTINIFSAKTDYHQQLGNTVTLDAGYKSSFVNTDNLAQYYLKDGNDWQTDFDKTNHFLYRERIHALYASSEKKFKHITVQGGLRYEYTGYKAEQKGNIQRKDSLFSRKYDGIFPTLFAQVKADSNHSFSITAGRRIDRPPYQKLNPFVFVINKYTYQQGNPFFKPQYTWNFQFSHQFRQLFITTLNYSVTTDYFSQIFLSLPDGILIYTEGNLGRMRNVGISVSSQFNIADWWSVSAQGNLYNKKIEGVVWNERQTALTQFNMNLNNQFRLGKGWSAEISGFFVTKEQELQEITDPTGQVTAGIAKQVLKNKGSLRLTLRDIFYTQAMKGDTDFEQAFEYFKLTRDTRVLTFAFSYRFGKSFKVPSKRSGATEEVERVGTGG
ncbi:MAG: TonB-dependent receptor [Chitinophagaceae bacterium]|nr:MAG: TonB-dependent receptor [Chitinophagaceae bacterium]